LIIHRIEGLIYEEHAAAGSLNEGHVGNKNDVRTVVQTNKLGPGAPWPIGSEHGTDRPQSNFIEVGSILFLGTVPYLTNFGESMDNESISDSSPIVQANFACS